MATIAAIKYAATVGTSSPRMITATIKIINPKNKFPPHHISTEYPIFRPRPVFVTKAIIGPRVAQATATRDPIVAPRMHPSFILSKDGRVSFLIKLNTISEVIPQKAANIGGNPKNKRAKIAIKGTINKGPVV